MQTKRAWTEEDFDLLDQYYALEARESLWAFRRYMNPDMRIGWFPQSLSDEVQRFYRMLKAGMRPMMVIEAPPQHGKSYGLVDAIAWMSGKDPNMRTIYASFSDDLGVRANLQLQRMMDDPKYQRVFPAVGLSRDNVVSQVGRYLRNSSMLEFVGHKGSFQNTTVEGQVNGKSLDLGIIDDPLKGRAEANSRPVRNKVWNWLTDDFYTRFSEYAGIIITATRWHVDDPSGRWTARYPNTIVVKYPALATTDERYRKKDEPLFREFKSLEFLMERKKSMTNSSWQSLYQQSPIVEGGGMFPIQKFRILRELPATNERKKLVRYWDKAGTQDGGAYTAGTLMMLVSDSRYIVVDVVRGQWNAFAREAYMKATAEKDQATFGRVEIYTEQEPGSGGKESAERTVKNLQGYIVKTDRVTGSKEVRAEPYAAQVQGGNVFLLASEKWNQEFIDEHETFPNGKYKDQVDSAAGAFNKLVSKTYKYDSSLSWVG
jgi:predicted phage terminase large subunit-like protein